jgi:hypothetical protein
LPSRKKAKQQKEYARRAGTNRGSRRRISAEEAVERASGLMKRYDKLFRRLA